ALIIGVEVWHLGTNDDSNSGRGICQMPSICAVDSGQLAQEVAIADYHEFPWLTVARAARPAGDFQNVVQDWLGQRVRSELAYGAQAAQKCNPRTGGLRGRGVGHRRAFCRGAGSRKTWSTKHRVRLTLSTRRLHSRCSRCGHGHPTTRVVSVLVDRLCSTLSS